MKSFSILFLLSFACTTWAQTFNPSASNLPDAHLNQAYSDQVISFTVPPTSTLPGDIVEQALSVAFPQAAPALGLLNLSSQTFDFNVTRSTFNVDGLPQGMSGNCDATPCTYLAGASGSITITGTPTEAGNFTFDILSYTEGDVDLSSLGGGLLSTLGIPSSFDLPAPVPQALDETGYTITVLDANGIAEHNEMFSLNFYPNPAQDLSILDINSTVTGLANVEIFAITGASIRTEARSIRSGNNRIPIDMSALPAGVYMLRTQIGGYQALVRVLKNG
ncbi:MAG: T9SS type A sorting domain-containing protein [Flavobacteriales bacterium]|nr:T9SS type A sorting domain-containing protein [Flavobacteriales bacterium]